MRMPLLSLLVALAVVGPSVAAGFSALRIDQLRCDYRRDPTGMDVRKPRLSWVLVGSRRGLAQTAYRILAASTPDLLARDWGDDWDSGRVASGRTAQVIYAGRPLASRMRVYWRVRVWDQNGRPSAWSRTATWTMGLLDKSDWGARWIADAERLAQAQPLTDGRLASGAAAFRREAVSATMMRKSFDLPAAVRRATVYVTGLGLYELRINGHRVGDHRLAPEWTDYRKRIQYQTYEVTHWLRQGPNVIGAVLGEGWYAGRLMTAPQGDAYGSFCRFLLQLEIELADGRTERVVTDGSWRSTTDGPIRSAGIYDGETDDARKAMPGWDRRGFDDRAWKPVKTLNLGEAALVWQPDPPIRITRKVHPVRIGEPRPRLYVFDFGQNLVGWCRLEVRGRAGTEVTLRFGEVLNPDGTVYRANLRAAAETDRYILRGRGRETFEPHFTYHGFRYVEITGLPQAPTQDAVIALVVHTAAPVAGRFECSDPLVNQLMHNIRWTQRGNMMGVPTDCPQRDERYGWMGDIQAFSQTAIFNRDMAAFFSKWVRDIRDDQAEDGRYPDFAPHPGDPNQGGTGTPAWGDAGAIIPWRMYVNYGDTRVLHQQFESARRWIDYIHRHNPNLIWADARGGNYNDWLNGDWLRLKGWPPHGAAVPPDVLATAFFAHSTEIVAQMARVLGREVDARRYHGLFEQIKAAFNARFVQPDGTILGDTQAGYALALHFNLLPAAARPKAVQHLLATFKPYHGHLSTGIQTTARLMLELTRNGYSEVACDAINLRSCPSWGYMIDNGATTIWERWDGYVKGRGFQDPGMNSFNHWALGSVGEWVWRDLAGLNPDAAQPGYQHFIICPHPGKGITWVKSTYDSIRGRIVCDWRIAKRTLHLDVTVPPNTTATVYVPTIGPAAVRVNGQAPTPPRNGPPEPWDAKVKTSRQATPITPGVASDGRRWGANRYQVRSGTYHFTAPFVIPEM